MKKTAKKLGWGVIGACGIARRRTIPEGIVPSSNGRLVAVMDVAKDAVAEVGAQFGARVYRREADLLADPEVAAVYIATPARHHHRQAMAAIAAGKHVLVEKPMALALDECREILAAARRKKVRVGVDFMMRFHAHHEKIRAMVAAGDLGTPVMGRAQLSCWYPPIPGAWRQAPKQGGGGSLIDMGCHCIDLLEHIFGSPAKEVFCFTGRLVHRYPVEDTAVLTARLANGAVCIADACFSIPDNSSKNILEIYGSGGSVIARGTIGQGAGGEATAYLERGSKGYDAKQARSSSAEIAVKTVPVNIYRAQVESFAAAVLAGREAPVPGTDGLRNQAIMLAAYRSAATGKAVRL